ncbi:MAG: hypothetical protein QXU98_13855 [Candidatus Parvarchaeota archaeon]
MSYVTIFQRIRSILISGMIDEINASSSKGMKVIIDLSGLKLTQRGDCFSKRWNVSRKGWIKMHVAI